MNVLQQTTNKSSRGINSLTTNVNRKSFISQGYIAFPRLGRGYLAFPRLGRSQSGNDANDEASASCCPLGLKTEWILAEAGKADTRNICPAEAPCCEELQEILDQRPDGSFYSMCVPSCYSDSVRNSFFTFLSGCS